MKKGGFASEVGETWEVENHHGVRVKSLGKTVERLLTKRVCSKWFGMYLFSAKKTEMPCIDLGAAR